VSFKLRSPLLPAEPRTPALSCWDDTENPGWNYCCGHTNHGSMHYGNSQLTQAEPWSIQAKHWKPWWIFIPRKWLHWYIIFVPCLFEEKKGGYRNRRNPSVHPSVTLCVRSITLSFIKWIWNNLAQMFVIIRRCVMRNNQTPTSRVKVELAHSRSTLSIVYLRVYVVSGP
jgi:hypothetical protein